MTTKWNGKTLTATEAAEALAIQVVVAARKAMQHQIEQGKRSDEIHLDGKTLIWEILSEAGSGHMGEYLQRCTSATTFRTVRTHVKRMTSR